MPPASQPAPSANSGLPAGILEKWQKSVDKQLNDNPHTEKVDELAASGELALEKEWRGAGQQRKCHVIERFFPILGDDNAKVKVHYAGQGDVVPAELAKHFEELMAALARNEDVFDRAATEANAAKAAEAAGTMDDEMRQYQLALDQAISEMGAICTKCYGDFDDTKLYGAKLKKARLGGVNLAGAQLQGAALDNGELIGARLASANLTGAALAWTDITQGSGELEMERFVLLSSMS
ncbi:unnamed protein product [Symbiodinium sp. CCMP2592]|nr:unnamed protein product [Symbiodinium sp. CCMP2592]